MADIVFNIAKGRAAYYGTLPATNDALVLVPLEAAGLEADAMLRDYDNLATLLAGASNEQTTIGRLTITAPTATVDDANDLAEVDMDNPVWVGATGNPLGAVVVCYCPDLAATDDSTLILLTKHDFAVTPNGADLTATVVDTCFYRAT